MTQALINTSRHPRGRDLVATRKDPIDLVDLPAKIRDYYNEGKADKFLVTKIKGTNKWMLKSWRSKKG